MTGLHGAAVRTPCALADAKATTPAAINAQETSTRLMLPTAAQRRAPDDINQVNT